MSKGPWHPPNTVRKRVTSYRREKPDNNKTATASIKRSHRDRPSEWKHYSQTFSSNTQARQRGAEMLDALKNPKYHSPADSPVTERMDRGLRAHSCVRPMRIPSYRDTTKYIERAWVSVPLTRPPSGLQRLEGTARRTVQYVHVLAKMALKTSTDGALVPFNPAAAANLTPVETQRPQDPIDVYVAFMNQGRIQEGATSKGDKTLSWTEITAAIIDPAEPTINMLTIRGTAGIPNRMKRSLKAQVLVNDPGDKRPMIALCTKVVGDSRFTLALAEFLDHCDPLVSLVNADQNQGFATEHGNPDGAIIQHYQDGLVSEPESRVGIMETKSREDPGHICKGKRLGPRCQDATVEHGPHQNRPKTFPAWCWLWADQHAIGRAL